MGTDGEEVGSSARVSRIKKKALSTRQALIPRLEALRGSRVICYVTGDRQHAAAQIGDDAVRPLYEHLRAFGHVKKLDLLIYSRGGGTDIPWRMASAIRRVCDEWHVLVPFRANSAATLLALGEDTIVLGKQAELGPIDPSLTFQRVDNRPGQPSTTVQDTVSVEDVMSYIKFVQERAGLSDQSARAQALAMLAARVDAMTLGSIYRTHSHIRDVARRMLQSRAQPASDAVIGTIVETLAERVYAHGHAIGLNDAKEMGLPAEAAPDKVDAAMWRLLNQYEHDLKLMDPVDPIGVLGTGDEYTEQVVLAAIDSTWGSHEFGGILEVKGKRQMPSTLNVSVNLNLSVQMPAGLPADQQAAIQQFVQQLQAPVVEAAQEAAQQAVKQQAPLLNVETGVRRAKWEKVA